MINTGLPLITCAMVTKGRFDHLKRSVECYLRQTYPNKNLIVLSQGSDVQNALIENHFSSLNRPDIVFMTAPEDLCLGAMRNTSVELATGKIICQWDDDDLYHPERLMTQYNALRVNSNYVASAYCDFLKYYRNTGEIYWCDWSGERIFSGRLLSGSVMFYKEMFGMFPCFYPQSGSQCHVEEDLNVMNKLLSKGEVAPIWSGWHYVYMYHGSNTYDLAHHNLTLDVTSGKKVLTASQLLERRDLIENAFDSIGFDRSVSVRSKEGLAFTYDPKRRIIDS